MTAVGAGFNFGPAKIGWRWVADAIWRIEHAFERAGAEGKPADAVKRRMVLILAVFAAGFITLSLGATRTAIFPNDIRKGFISALPAGARADLTDRNGQLLAVDLPYFSLYLDKRLIWDMEETRQRLGPLLTPVARTRMEMALRAGKRFKVMGPMSPQQKAVIDDLGLPGVSFEGEAKRTYPLGATATHLIGFAGSDGGLGGAELALDRQIATGAGHAPVALAMDLRIQAALEDEVQKAAIAHSALGAVGLVTNVRTGEILGMVSYPDAAPDDLSASESARTNRAANSVYEMGSTFKIFTTATGLDSGVATLNSTFDATAPLVLPGQVIHDYHGTNRSMTVSDVFLHSSNIGTAKLALQAGGPTMTKYFRNFGLFSAAPVELAESARPITPRKWTDNIVATTSFGHAISVSPLTLAGAVGSIMNGGTYVPLTILKRDAPPADARRVVSENTSRQMLDLMRLNAVKGTGGFADRAAPGYRMGGKTGTAEKVIAGRYDRSKLVSSFAAIFPTDGALTDDRYFVVIIVDEPHSSAEFPGRPTGGIAAAPAVGRVINRIAPFVGVERRIDPPVPAVIAAAADPAHPALNAEER